MQAFICQQSCLLLFCISKPWISFAETEKSLVQVNKQEGTLEADKAISEEGSKQNDNDHEIGDTEIYIDLGDILFSEHANTETNNDNEGMQQIRSTNQFSCLYF